MRTKILTAKGELDTPERVLVVVAHPDDIDFGTAGTVAALTSAGTVVSYCLVTSGEAGDDDLSRSSKELAEERQGEQTSAAEIVGVSKLHWLHHPDGRVVSNLELRRDISGVIRKERPDIVICQSTEANWDRIYGAHPDHLATAWATMASIYPDSRNPRAHPELLEAGYEPHTVKQAWMMGLGIAETINLNVDITDTFSLKLSALQAHHSQTERIENLEELLREWALDRATAAGMEPGRLAEAFRVINTE
ncbi:MAG: PIG-L family deacetylase [Acidimicrobiales bacterium]|nr:PIG-L family deacetylase [Acidimicrobiales bacterium]